MGMTSNGQSASVSPAIAQGRSDGAERRSVDFVPVTERHGTVRHLGAVWIVANINLTAMATGATTLALGGSLFWTLVATVFGSLFGTLFMALHSSQGPHLGLPQLVQSRAQFGFLGAAITVWVFALVNYFNYNVADAILAGSSLNFLLGIPISWGFPIAVVFAGTLALYGYRWIHRVNRFLVVPLGLTIVILTYAAVARGGVSADAFAPGPIEWHAFATTFVIVAGFQLGWAPYVSDYSRYLAPTVSTRASFLWTYLPSAISALWVIGLGSLLAAAAPGATVITAIAQGGDALFAGGGRIAVALLFIGLLVVMALNAYGGSLTLISILDCFRRVRPSLAMRAITIMVMTLSVWIVAAMVGEERFNLFYGNVLVFLAYLFTPWTAINLVDFYLVRKGCYSIRELFNPAGIYGRWGWQGNVAYIGALAAMVPFFVTAPYTGWIARQIGDIDISMFVGLLVASALYLLTSRTLDLGAERSLVEKERKVSES
ncbi:purine-cytosine permease family protein [Metapseudomonas furukawaii]|nr:cytosine permease [Pseudomonas furukawaii]